MRLPHAGIRLTHLRTAVFGASGYAGGELVRLLDAHPVLELVHLGAHSRAGSTLGAVHPQLSGGERPLGGLDLGSLPAVDVVFLALPHGASAELAHELAERGAAVVDLGSDFRLDTADRYRQAYGSEHSLVGELPRWRYGLPELFDLAGARRVAAPGCYPTAVLLAIVPLLRAGLVEVGTIVADCLSGVSGAGRSLREDLLFGSVAEGVRAYNVTRHRHRPEIEMGIEQATGTHHAVVFTPHLVPMQRGELATVTAPARPGVGEQDLRDALRSAYAGRPFVTVVEEPPQTRWASGSNRAFVTAFFDEPTGSVIAQAAIDNLVKGAAGQAIQAANLVFGLAEETGLPLSGWLP
ncbi:MAG: N-acetyl-gamma-glutamyl-phosphate reductase [Acidimicrobiia bacterium]